MKTSFVRHRKYLRNGRETNDVTWALILDFMLKEVSLSVSPGLIKRFFKNCEFPQQYLQEILYLYISPQVLLNSFSELCPRVSYETSSSTTSKSFTGISIDFFLFSLFFLCFLQIFLHSSKGYCRSPSELHIYV